MTIYNNQDLYDILKELEFISQDQLDDSLKVAQTNEEALGDVLLDKNLMDEEELGKLIADLLSIPFIRLTDIRISPEVLNIVPELVAKKQRVISFKKDDRGLHIATTDPGNLEIFDFLKKKEGVPLIIYFTTSREINKSINLYRKDIVKAFEQVIKENIEQAKSKNDKEVDPPVIKIVETVISYAYESNASDIHLEPEEEFSLVRFRIDGVLHDILRIPTDIYTRVVTRIKVLSKLRIDEHQTPQDGKISFELEDQALDVRISIVPTQKGEKIVMRLLSEHARKITLSSLGFSDDDLQKVKAAYSKPYGMILSTGPTGSGKTTTMYAILKLLNKRDVNIMTIEDPIEYKLEGINQIQVNVKANLTFAAGLRSILRQDPNIILVGEIRDEETAGIAVNSALTGHLVLSTLHTNDAATAIPRLFDMGIEPFLIASTVNVIIAQRLLRRIHSVCRVSNDVKREELRHYFDESTITKTFGDAESIRLYKGKGCSICHDTGYADRLGIYEVLIVDDEIRESIVNKSDMVQVKDLAVKKGMRTMIQDGLEKVKKGETTIEEVMRVTKE
jgi:type IV pilus assembly protein PilB